MGVADRTYMRGAPGGRVTPATHLVLGVLVGIFILGLVAHSSRTDFLGWMQLETPGAQPWQWLTYALLHGDFWHLLGNGLILWWVGPLVEAEHGRGGLLRILVLGTLAGAVAWFLTGLGGGKESIIIGASAAVLAAMVMGLDGREDESVTLLLFFFLPVTLKVRWVMAVIWGLSVCGWVFSELPGRHDWPAWAPAWNSQIAHSAHLGGLIVGWLAARRVRIQADSGLVLQETAPSPLARVPRPGPPAAASAPASAPASLGARAELDRLLDKISAEGFGSLTPDERQRLDELSQRLR
jgi:membrane associated rhomboid family serine protease